jgi:hypothetical protein
MGSKNSPGIYDCHSKAEPDEPTFTLLGRDPTAAALVAVWVAMRASDLEAALRIVRNGFHDLQQSGKPIMPYDAPKSVEAQQCAKAMDSWYRMKQMDAIEKRLEGK